MSFTVGDKFQSFALWEETVKKYELENHVRLWKRDARSIQAARKRMPNRQLNEDLQYYDLQYCCIKGGRKYTTRTTGSRPNTSTFRSECGFQIRLKATKNGQHLEVITMNTEHNHSVKVHASKHKLSNKEEPKQEKEKEAKMKNRSQDDNVGEKFTSSKVVENDTSSNVVENDTSDVENNDTSSEVIENITSSILRSCVELIPSSGPITVHGSLTVVSEGLTYLMLIHKTLQTHSTEEKPVSHDSGDTSVDQNTNEEAEVLHTSLIKNQNVCISGCNDGIDVRTTGQAKDTNLQQNITKSSTSDCIKSARVSDLCLKLKRSLEEPGDCADSQPTTLDVQEISGVPNHEPQKKKFCDKSPLVTLSESDPYIVDFVEDGKDTFDIGGTSSVLGGGDDNILSLNLDRELVFAHQNNEQFSQICADVALSSFSSTNSKGQKETYSNSEVLPVVESSLPGRHPHQCVYCDKRFPSHSKLVRHQVTHTRQRPHRCKQCGKEFSQSYDLIQHERKHSGEKLVCDICNQDFVFASNLARHKRKHETE